MAIIKLREASELLIQGSAYLPSEEAVSSNDSNYQQLLNALMLLQRVSQAEQ